MGFFRTILGLGKNTPPDAPYSGTAVNDTGRMQLKEGQYIDKSGHVRNLSGRRAVTSPIDVRALSIYTELMREYAAWAEQPLPYYDFAETKEPEFWEHFERDASFKTNIIKRKYGLINSPWNVVPIQPGYDTQAATIQSILEQTPHLPTFFARIVMAIMRGYSVQELVWGRVGGYIGITKIKHASKDRWHWVTGKGWHYRGDMKELGFGTPVDMSADKFVMSAYEEDLDHPYGQGLSEACYWGWTFKRGSIMYQTKYIERFGGGVVKGYSPNAESREALMAHLEDAVNGAIFALETNEVLDFWEPSGTGNQIFSEFIRQIDMDIRTLIVGNTLSTTEGARGNQALGETHQQEQHEYIKHDQLYVQEIINEQVIPALCFYNFGDRGLPVKFTFDTSVGEPLNDSIQRDLQIAEKIDVGENFIREKYNTPIPEEGEKVIPKQSDDMGGMMGLFEDDEGVEFGKKKHITRDEFLKSLAGRGLTQKQKLRLWNLTKTRGRDVEPEGSEARKEAKRNIGKAKRLGDKLQKLRNILEGVSSTTKQPNDAKSENTIEQINFRVNKADKIIKKFPAYEKMLPAYKDYLDKIKPDEYGDIKGVSFSKYAKTYSDNIRLNPENGNVEITTNKGQINIPKWKHDEIAERSSSSMTVEDEKVTTPDHTIKEIKETEKAILIKIFFNYGKNERMNNEFWIPKSQVVEYSDIEDIDAALKDVTYEPREVPGLWKPTNDMETVKKSAKVQLNFINSLDKKILRFERKGDAESQIRVKNIKKEKENLKKYLFESLQDAEENIKGGGNSSISQLQNSSFGMGRGRHYQLIPKNDEEKNMNRLEKLSDIHAEGFHSNLSDMCNITSSNYRISFDDGTALKIPKWLGDDKFSSFNSLTKDVTVIKKGRETDKAIGVEYEKKGRDGETRKITQWIPKSQVVEYSDIEDIESLIDDIIFELDEEIVEFATRKTRDEFLKSLAGKGMTQLEKERQWNSYKGQTPGSTAPKQSPHTAQGMKAAATAKTSADAKNKFMSVIRKAYKSGKMTNAQWRQASESAYSINEPTAEKYVESLKAELGMSHIPPYTSKQTKTDKEEAQAIADQFNKKAPSPDKVKGGAEKVIEWISAPLERVGFDKRDIKRAGYVFLALLPAPIPGVATVAAPAFLLGATAYRKIKNLWTKFASTPPQTAKSSVQSDYLERFLEFIQMPEVREILKGVPEEYDPENADLDSPEEFSRAVDVSSSAAFADSLTAEENKLEEIRRQSDLVPGMISKVVIAGRTPQSMLNNLNNNKQKIIHEVAGILLNNSAIGAVLGQVDGARKVEETMKKVKPDDIEDFADEVYDYNWRANIKIPSAFNVASKSAIDYWTENDDFDLYEYYYDKGLEDSTRIVDELIRTVTEVLAKGLPAKQAVERIQVAGLTHAKTVFRTNLARSFAQGRERKINEHPNLFPAWVMRTARDGRVRGKLDDNPRGDHWALDGCVLTRDNPIAEWFSYPADYNCRCRKEPVPIYQRNEKWVKNGIAKTERLGEQAFKIGFYR